MGHGHDRLELRLHLAGPDDSPPPPPLRPPLPAVDCWRDNAGDVCAYTYEHAGQFFMDWPAVARFCFDGAGHFVRAWPREGVALASVERVHRRAVVPAALQCLGHETLHASAVRLSQGVVGFCGQAGAGKSTLAMACTWPDAEQWADDTLVMEVGSGRVKAIPIAYDVALRQPSIAHFGDRAERVRVIQASGGPAPLRALFLIDRASAASPLVLALDPTVALQALLPHACAFSMTDMGRRRLMVEQYLALVDLVPVYQLSYPSTFECLPDVADLVRSTVAGQEPATVR